MAGLLVVVSGPSAAGKGTICKELVETTDIELSVSATTRDPRPGEIHGRDYFFLSENEFLDTIRNGGFLEHVQNFGNRYGTLLSHVKEKTMSGKDIILEIDVQGAEIIKKKFPECVLIFILPPSLNVLSERMIKRGTETPEKIEQRLKNAKKEIDCLQKYDYYIVNDDIHQAVENMKCIIKAEHLSVHRVSQDIIARFKEE